MIRTGLPAPFLLRLRLRAQLASRQLARQAQALREGCASSLRGSMETLRRLPVRGAHSASAVVAAPADQTALFSEFETQYEELVDLLCWSAKEGVNDNRDARYQEIRGWFTAHYEAVRPQLQPHLETLSEDLTPFASGELAPRDAFESLFLPQCMDALIHSDTVIDRILRTRAALDALKEQRDTPARH